RGRTFIGDHMRATLRHYELLEREPAVIEMARAAAIANGIADPTMSDLIELMAQGFINTQVSGTPSQCLEKITAVAKLVQAGEIVINFHYGSISAAEAEHSARLFAAEVLPALHALESAGDSEAVPFREVQRMRAEHSAAAS